MAETNFKLTVGATTTEDLGTFFDKFGREHTLARLTVAATVEPPMHADLAMDCVWNGLPPRDEESDFPFDKLDLGPEDDEENVSQFTYTQIAEVEGEAATNERVAAIAASLTASFAEVPIEA